NRLQAHLRLVIDSRDGGGGPRPIPVRVDVIGFWDSCSSSPSGSRCDLDLNTRDGRPFVGLIADITLRRETQAARAGYTRVDIGSISIAPGENIEDDDVNPGCNSGFL